MYRIQFFRGCTTASFSCPLPSCDVTCGMEEHATPVFHLTGFLIRSVLQGRNA